MNSHGKHSASFNKGKSEGKHAKETAKHAATNSSKKDFSDPYKDYGSTVRAVFALIVAGIISLFLLKSCVSAISQNNAEDSTQDKEQNEELIYSFFPEDNRPTFKSTPESLDVIPTSSALQTFSLSDSTTDSLTREEREEIQNNVSAIEETASVGFVFYNTKTGKGVSYNPDEPLYGASSFKAPYALYICEQHIETGEITLPGLDESAPYYGKGALTESLIENSIIYSDNDSYGTMRTLYDNSGFDEWVTALGAPDAVILSDSWFPWYCARSSAKLWTEMNNYFQTESETAYWLRSLCSQTNLSFLRNGLDSYNGVSVLNKGGWCVGEDYSHNYNSVCDAGIITFNGQTYIMSVMTELPDSPENELLVENLIASIFTVHETLNA